MVKLLPNAEALTEFLGYTGDCGETAELVSLHSLFGTPLDATHLNAIVSRTIARKEADATGAETLQAIADDLATVGVKSTTRFSEPLPDWEASLKPHAGVVPVILELALAGKLPGDEPGVHYHFICCVGVDDAGNYIFADGDNTAAKEHKLVTYSVAQIQSSQPCGVLICEVPVIVALPGGWWKDTRTGQSYGGGIHDEVVAKKIDLPCVVSEFPFAADGSSCSVFSDGKTYNVVVWNNTLKKAEDDVGGLVVLSLVKKLAASSSPSAAMKALNDKLTASEAAKAASAAEAKAAEEALAQVRQQLEDDTIQLDALKKQLADSESASKSADEVKVLQAASALKAAKVVDAVSLIDQAKLAEALALLKEALPGM